MDNFFNEVEGADEGTQATKATEATEVQASGMAQGCHMEVNGNILTVKVDLTKDEGRSASGKTVVIASSHGNRMIALPSGRPAWVGVNVYKK